MDSGEINGLTINMYMIENKFTLIKNGDKFCRANARNISCEIAPNNVAFLETFSNRSVIHVFNSATWEEEKTVPFDSKLKKLVVAPTNNSAIEKEMAKTELLKKYSHLNVYEDKIKELVELGNQHVLVIWKRDQNFPHPYIASLTATIKPLMLDNDNVQYITLANGKVVVISPNLTQDNYQTLFIISPDNN